MEKAIIKFNNGRLAMLCSNCRTIIKTGIDFTQEEKTAIKWDKLPSQYCKQCKSKENDSQTESSETI